MIGKPTNKIWTYQLHLSKQFGTLPHWLEIDVMKVIKTVERDGWL
ncbi:hypothetical protein ACFFGV_04890 [Pontibacillus salicampi]|uniref:Uncharacterized protein n=1 Tax=Pontibacillus salicampi TaxID=1449801 RepID=A0ABV6LKL4_9BACI